MLIVKLIRALLIVLVFLTVFFPIYINTSAFAEKTAVPINNTQFNNAGLSKEFLIPDLVEHEGILYERDPYWEKYEEVVYSDIDGDSENELIVRFRSSNEHMPAAAITVIYDFNKDKKSLTKTIIGGETPKKMELSDIDKDGIKDLILYDHAGNHYTVIKIYSFKDNDYKCLFENGTACYMYEVNTDIDPVRITIGRENWKDEGFCYAVSDKKSLLEVWEWDGKGFTYSPFLSTTPLIGEKEAIELTWQDIKGKMGDKSKEKGDMSESDAEYMAKCWIGGRRYLELEGGR